MAVNSAMMGLFAIPALFIYLRQKKQAVKEPPGIKSEIQEISLVR